MATVHFTTIPCEPNEAISTHRTSYFGEIHPCTDKIAFARFEVFRPFFVRFMSGFKIFVRYELWVNVSVAIFFGAVFTDNLVASQHGAISDLGEFSGEFAIFLNFRYYSQKFTQKSMRTVRQNGELQRHGNMASVEQRFAEMYLFEWTKELKMVVGLRYVYTLCFQFSLCYRFQGGPKIAEILNLFTRRCLILVDEEL